MVRLFILTRFSSLSVSVELDWFPYSCSLPFAVCTTGFCHLSYFLSIRIVWNHPCFSCDCFLFWRMVPSCTIHLQGVISTVLILMNAAFFCKTNLRLRKLPVLSTEGYQLLPLLVKQIATTNFEVTRVISTFYWKMLSPFSTYEKIAKTNFRWWELDSFYWRILAPFPSCETNYWPRKTSNADCC